MKKKQGVDSKSSQQRLLADLKSYLQLAQDKRKITLPSLPETKKPRLFTEDKSTREDASKTIQHFWRNHQLRKTIYKDFYQYYLSLLFNDKEIRKYELSKIMLGKHVAEIPVRFNNPFISIDASYSRDEPINISLMERLLKAFKIPIESLDEYLYIPVLKSEQISIVDYLPKEFKLDQIIDEKHSFSLLRIQKRKDLNEEQIKKVIYALGLTPSPWEIASNIDLSAEDNSAILKTRKEIKLDPTLPSTKSALTASHLFDKLHFIAKSKKHGTHLLAECLIKLIRNFPEMDAQTIQRIAMILEHTNLFYEYNYPKFAFSVYIIIHELTLALLTNRDEKFLEKEFQDFLAESKSALYKALDLQETDIGKANFFASPAASGASAYTIALQLSKKMISKTGERPKIKVFKPAYYEFNNITIEDDVSSSEADIFIICAGAIATSEGVTAGVDINAFVQQNIVDCKRKDKPVTIVIDATSALYQNLKLNDQTKGLIKSGKLSIIVHESHQKFGLMHTDQVQYGRVFGILSADCYEKTAIKELEKQGETMFKRCVDLQAGAFISTHCNTTLEKIKEQHFANGAMANGILKNSASYSTQKLEHTARLDDLEKLYFTILPQLGEILYPLKKIVDQRDSFGHYHFSISGIPQLGYRLSADAADDQDCLIKTSQIYILFKIGASNLEKTIISLLMHPEHLKFEFNEQIIYLALINNFISLNDREFKKMGQGDFILLYHNINKIIRNCHHLTKSQYYTKAQAFISEYRDRIVKILGEKINKKSLFTALDILADKDIRLDGYIVDELIQNPEIIASIIQFKNIKFNSILLNQLMYNPELLKIIQKFPESARDQDKLEAILPTLQQDLFTKIENSHYTDSDYEEYLDNWLAMFLEIGFNFTDDSKKTVLQTAFIYKREAVIKYLVLHEGVHISQEEISAIRTEFPDYFEEIFTKIFNESIKNQSINDLKKIKLLLPHINLINPLVLALDIGFNEISQWLLAQDSLSYQLISTTDFRKIFSALEKNNFIGIEEIIKKFPEMKKFISSESLSQNIKKFILELEEAKDLNRAGLWDLAPIGMTNEPKWEAIKILQKHDLLSTENISKIKHHPAFEKALFKLIENNLAEKAPIEAVIAAKDSSTALIKAAAILLQKALDNAIRATGDPKKKVILNCFITELKDVTNEKVFAKMFMSAERVCSHHTNLFKNRQSNSTTKAFASAEPLFTTIRDLLSEKLLVAQNKVLTDKPHAINGQYHTYHFFAKSLNNQTQSFKHEFEFFSP